MAYYKDLRLLGRENGDEYDLFYNAGDKAPYTGIYRCAGCGNSRAAYKGDRFPPPNHHDHNALQTKMRWQLVVKSNFER